MPNILNVWKKILAYILCGCYNIKRKSRYSGYYNANKRTVAIETNRTRTLRNSKRTPPRNGTRERVCIHDENEKIQTCKSSRQTPQEWQMFNLEKRCEVLKDGGICWLDVSLSKIMMMIETAVRKDALKPISNDVKHSTSAVDVMALFYQIKDATYEHIDVDNIGETYKCVAKILHDFCKCALFFIDEIAKKTKSLREARQSNRPFKITPEMCCGINTSEYMHQSIFPFVNKMNLEEISKDLGAAHSEIFATQWHHNLRDTVERTSESAQRKVLDQLGSVIEQMEPTIKRMLLEESKQCKTEHCEGLLEYLSQNFLIMHVQLDAQYFEHLLTCVWNCSVTNIRGFLNAEKKSSKSVPYKRLRTTLQSLESFLKNLDGSKKIEFTSIHSLLGPELIHGSSECIHQYHLERMTQQNSLTSIGVVAVKMYFINRILKIEILNARDIILPTKKLSVKCNPYIKIQVLPKEKYKSIGKIKTKVQKNTVYPVFDETFLIKLTAEQCSINNAIIRFTLKSHNLINRTFLGETFIQLSQVPYSSECSLSTAQQQLLRLTRPMSTGYYSIQALKDCKSEKIKKFIKKEKLKLKL